MSYVDLIIKYLSGDLSQEEATSFEKELETDEALKRAFEEQSTAYNLIRNQIQKRDEMVFREKLKEAMNHETKRRSPQIRWLRRRWFIPVAAACVLLFILTIRLNQPSWNEKVLSRYYDPNNDPVVLAFSQDTRGGSDPGVVQYNQGNYREAMRTLSDHISNRQSDKQLVLYYLLSAIELNRQDEVMEMTEVANPDSLDLADQAITWYSTLALLKSDRREEALERIQPLTLQQGPYQSDAHKLEKVLLK